MIRCAVSPILLDEISRSSTCTAASAAGESARCRPVVRVRWLVLLSPRELIQEQEVVTNNLPQRPTNARLVRRRELPHAHQTPLARFTQERLNARLRWR